MINEHVISAMQELSIQHVEEESELLDASSQLFDSRFDYLINLHVAFVKSNNEHFPIIQ
ncbi:MAG: hypothetical protein WCH59_08115 [Chitinophagia bacterium]|jgi:hypothetical protein